MKSFLSLLESSWRLNYKKHENKSPGSRSPMKEQFNMGPMTWFTVFLGIAWPQITLSLHIEGNSWDFSFIPHSLAIAFCATHCSPDNVQSHKTVPNIIIIWFQLLLFFFMLSKFPVIWTATNHASPHFMIKCFYFFILLRNVVPCLTSLWIVIQHLITTLSISSLVKLLVHSSSSLKNGYLSLVPHWVL